MYYGRIPVVDTLAELAALGRRRAATNCNRIQNIIAISWPLQLLLSSLSDITKIQGNPLHVNLARQAVSPSTKATHFGRTSSSSHQTGQQNGGAFPRRHLPLGGKNQ